MVLPGSNQLLTVSDINRELLRSNANTFSTSDNLFRDLLAANTGINQPVSWGELRGRAFAILNITSNTNNYDIKSQLQSLGWSNTNQVTAFVNIASGVFVSGSANIGPALTSNTGYTDFSRIKIHISPGAFVVGKGGAGGIGGDIVNRTKDPFGMPLIPVNDSMNWGGPGMKGQPAIVSEPNLEIYNQGVIAGGGGGGGGANFFYRGATPEPGGGAGGGRTGTVISLGGAYGNNFPGNTITKANDGSYLAAGAGNIRDSQGGTGGNWGQKGTILNRFYDSSGPWGNGASMMPGFGGESVIAFRSVKQNTNTTLFTTDVNFRLASVLDVNTSISLKGNFRPESSNYHYFISLTSDDRTNLYFGRTATMANTPNLSHGYSPDAAILNVGTLSTSTDYPLEILLGQNDGPGGISVQTGFIDKNAYTEATYTTAGTYSWTVPTGVTTISAVLVGGGGSGGRGLERAGGADRSGLGGGGGGLRWINDLAVTPGEVLTIVVGAGGRYNDAYDGQDGGNSSISRSSTTLIFAGGGKKGTDDASSSASGGAGGSGSTVGGNIGGGNGGVGGGNSADIVSPPAGGGGGGYSGNGGQGGASSGGNGQDGAGGGGGGGEGGNDGAIGGGGGGGVGIFGRGSNGLGGNLTGGTGGGGGGSGGTNGENSGDAAGSDGGNGGDYGGGGGGGGSTDDRAGGAGGGGAIRIVFKRPQFATIFPSYSTTTETTLPNAASGLSMTANLQSQVVFTNNNFNTFVSTNATGKVKGLEVRRYKGAFVASSNITTQFSDSNLWEYSNANFGRGNTAFKIGNPTFVGSTANSWSNTGNVTIDVSGIGIQNGDYVVVVIQTSNNAAPVLVETGFTYLNQGTLAPTSNVYGYRISDGNSGYLVAYKIANNEPNEYTYFGRDVVQAVAGGVMTAFAVRGANTIFAETEVFSASLTDASSPSRLSSGSRSSLRERFAAYSNQLSVFVTTSDLRSPWATTGINTSISHGYDDIIFYRDNSNTTNQHSSVVAYKKYGVTNTNAYLEVSMNMTPNTNHRNFVYRRLNFF